MNENMTEEELEIRGEYSVDAGGLICNPGKFEGCGWVAVLCHKIIAEGLNDDSVIDNFGLHSLVNITGQVKEINGLYSCAEDENGFFYYEKTTDSDWDELCEAAYSEPIDGDEEF